MPTSKSLTCRDGTSLKLTIYEALNTETSGGDNPLLVIAPAFGVPQSFYRDFSQYIASKGLNVLTFDYRNTSADNDNPRQKGQNSLGLKLSDWGTKDIDEILAFAVTQNRPIYYLGHSIGGQLLGLSKYTAQIKKAMFVGVSAPYWKRWPFPAKLKVLTASHLLIPSVAALTKHFPAKQLGLGNQVIPSPLFTQWAGWMRKPDYHLDKSFGLNQQHYADLRCELLSLGFSDDTLAPKQNIAHLLSFYPNAKSQIEIIEPKSIATKSIGHTGFFKKRFENSLWQKPLTFFSE